MHGPIFPVCVSPFVATLHSRQAGTPACFAWISNISDANFHLFCTTIFSCTYLCTPTTVFLSPPLPFVPRNPGATFRRASLVSPRAPSPPSLCLGRPWCVPTRNSIVLS